MNSTDFYFDGVASTSKDILLVKTENGLYKRHYLPEREIISEQIINNDIPYIYGVKNNPLRLSLTFTLDEGVKWSVAKRSEIARWFDNGKYNEFYTTDEPTRRYFLMYEGTSEFYDNGDNDGYIVVNFINISPYTYSDLFTLDFTSTGTLSFVFTNSGDTVIVPEEIRITKSGTSSFEIVNVSNSNLSFKFDELINNEVVTVYPKTRHITTTSNFNRYIGFSGDYLNFIIGINNINVIGNAAVQIKYRFEYKG